MFDVKFKRIKLKDPLVILKNGTKAILITAALQGESNAKTKVRVDLGDLRSSIKSELVNDLKSKFYTISDHNFAQEFGLPQAPAYGFTPYMRPAYDFIRTNLSQIAKIAMSRV